MIKKYQYPIILLIALMMLFTYGFDWGYGKKIKFNSGELYYTSSVTLTEANKLGQYLVQEGFFGEDEITVQINKTGSTYEFRMVIKKGIENDQDAIEMFKDLAHELSNNVFGGRQVDVHLCDEDLKTIRVVVAI